MRRTAADAALTRQEILDAALLVFSQKGYHAARLMDIATAANVTRGAIYHHFDNKAQLYTALLNEASDMGDNTLQEAIAAGGSFAEICARIMIESLALLEKNRRMRQIVELTLFKTGQDPELSELEEIRQQQATTIIESTAVFMRMGIENGDLSPDLDPFDAARAFIAFQNGLISLWLSNPAAFSIGERAPEFARILLKGIAV